jgi:hypothetical protein
VRKPFQNWRCGAHAPTSSLGWMNPRAHYCQRRGGHEGPHRNPLIEWDQGATYFYRRGDVTKTDIS